MVNPAHSAPRSGYGVDNYKRADNKATKQTKDHSDTRRYHSYNKRATVAQRRSGFLFKQDTTNKKIV